MGLALPVLYCWKLDRIYKIICLPRCGGQILQRDCRGQYSDL